MSKEYELFQRLLRAEIEEDVETILEESGYLETNPDIWQMLGDDENNWATVGNQHNHPTGALVEKIINAEDAVLIRGCWEKGLNPESDDAPQSMLDATRNLFNVPNGRLDGLTAHERTMLADNIQFVATGLKTKPNYLIIDKGEGQTPTQFPNTFLSLRGKNKYGIPFVQGINNCGGSAVLRFCGTNMKKFQLLVSRRHPSCFVAPDDPNAAKWGFTIIRSVLPKDAKRPRPIFVYLAPDGDVMTFEADSISVLPVSTERKKPATPYEGPLTHGTCIKLYNYGWSTKSLATTNAREELEKYLYSIALPIQITETRDYKANYFQTTVSGQAVNITTQAEGKKSRVEPDFNQVPLKLSLENIGEINIAVTLFRDRDDNDDVIDTKRVPYGTVLTVNGQVHDRLQYDFVRDKLNFAYLNKHMLIAIDCTAMEPMASTSLFSTARDRTVDGSKPKKEILDEIIRQLARDDTPLRSALRQLNARRREEQLKKTLNDEEPLKVLEGLVRGSPALAAIFNMGDRIVNPWQPEEDEPEPFVGMRFPTYFRIPGEPEDLKRPCPINRSCRVSFETDAENIYFTRADSPGDIEFTPSGLNRNWNLHNGRMSTTFMPPANAHVGDEVEIQVMVSDESTEEPFVCKFQMVVTEPAEEKEPGEPRPPRPPKGASKLAMPHPILVTRDGRDVEGKPSVSWDDREDFDETTALQMQPSGEDGKYDIYINMDNVHLKSELARERRSPEHPLITYYYKYGLLLVAMGMLHEFKRGTNEKPEAHEGNSQTAEEPEPNDRDYLSEINDACKGIAAVIVPLVQRLSASADQVLAATG